MKFYFLIFFSTLSLISCSKPSDLQQNFKCETTQFTNTEKVTDVQDKFTITVPKYWKTSLFYNTYQTQIQTADTIKQLSDTYILITALNNGTLDVNNTFKDKKIKQFEEEFFESVTYKFITFKEKPSIWFLAEGKKLNKTYTFFQLFIKNTATDYFEFSTEIYGDNSISERLCESIVLMEKVEF